MIKPSWYPSDKQLRQFAVASLPGFCLIAYMAHRWGAPLNASYAIAGVGALSFVVGLLVPRAVRPVYLLLMALTLPIGIIVSYLFLGIIYYVIFTPLGLFFRLIGRDPLRLKKPDGSYWKPHTQRTDAGSYFRQA